MLCQKCHKNLATVRYAEVVDGKVTEQHLCGECLKQHQQNAAKGFELAGPAPMLRRPRQERAARDVVRTEKACPSCGALLSRVTDSGKAGCSACYEHFGSQIESLLEGMHRALRHNGKVFRLDDTRARLRGDLQTKRALLRSALRTENYEEAARLRDEIRCLEQGLHISESGAE